MTAKGNINVKKIRKGLIDNALILALLVMIFVIILIEPAFLQWRVLKDVLTQSSVKLIVALGLIFPLLLGGTDLSGGRQVGLAAVIVASLSAYPDYPGGRGCDRLFQWFHDCETADGSVYRYVWNVDHRLWDKLPVFCEGTEPLPADRRNPGGTDFPQQL